MRPLQGGNDGSAGKNRRRDEARRLHEAGFSAGQIAGKLGVSMKAVEKYLGQSLRSERVRRAQALDRTGKSIEEICADLGVGASAVRKYVRYHAPDTITDWQVRGDELVARHGLVEGNCRLMVEWTGGRLNPPRQTDYDVHVFGSTSKTRWITG